jgi:hypothetical protein
MVDDSWFMIDGSWLMVHGRIPAVDYYTFHS